MSRLAILVLAALAAGRAGAEDVPKVPAESTKSISLPAGEFHEECMELAAGQRLGYSFRADSALEFNLHYHRDGKIQYPVRKNGVTTLAGAYTSPRSDGYCLMWRNPHPKAATLEYRFGTGIGNK